MNWIKIGITWVPIFRRFHSMPWPPNGSLNVSGSCLTIFRCLDYIHKYIYIYITNGSLNFLLDSPIWGSWHTMETSKNRAPAARWWQYVQCYLNWGDTLRGELLHQAAGEVEPHRRLPQGRLALGGAHTATAAFWEAGVVVSAQVVRGPNGIGMIDPG